MAGIGVRLQKIYSRRSIVAKFSGFAYSTVVTIAPMALVIVEIYIMGLLLGIREVGYARRELFSCTVLYIFIFSQLSAAPFNAVLSRFVSDVIYEERYGDIMPCFYTGLILNSIFSSVPAVIFCIREYVVGRVDAAFVLLGFIGYAASFFVFYTMLYLSICKEYGRISLFYFTGMGLSLVLSLLLVKVFSLDILTGMLLAVDIGFLLIGCLEFAQLRNYFKENNRTYDKVLSYFKSYFPLVVSNGLYVAGLYVHNFVFWTTDLKLEVASVFVCAEPYDMATFLALLTNLTSSMIFISNVEQRFHTRYKQYSEAVIGGRLIDIERTKERMFRQLSSELMSLARIQFIISVIIFLAFIVLLPRIGLSGLVLQIYPCLAAAYFLLFLMYGGLIFLYYFNDLRGAALTSIVFFSMTLLMSVVSSHLDVMWYGLGLFIGAVCGWFFVYDRLRWVEKNLETHTFCRGSLLQKGQGERPADRVFIRNAEKGET